MGWQEMGVLGGPSRIIIVITNRNCDEKFPSPCFVLFCFYFLCFSAHGTIAIFPFIASLRDSFIARALFFFSSVLVKCVFYSPSEQGEFLFSFSLARRLGTQTLGRRLAMSPVAVSSRCLTAVCFIVFFSCFFFVFFGISPPCVSQRISTSPRSSTNTSTYFFFADNI